MNNATRLIKLTTYHHLVPRLKCMELYLHSPSMPSEGTA